MTTPARGIYLRDEVVTDDEIHVLDWPRVGLSEVARVGHVHDLEGNCVKRRMGYRCLPPKPKRNPHEWGMYLLGGSLALVILVCAVIAQSV